MNLVSHISSVINQTPNSLSFVDSDGLWTEYTWFVSETKKVVLWLSDGQEPELCLVFQREDGGWTSRDMDVNQITL